MMNNWVDNYFIDDEQMGSELLPAVDKLSRE
jgi:hypothetical protein